MSLEKLSNNQLLHLVDNGNLDSHFLENIEKEINLRGLEILEKEQFIFSSSLKIKIILSSLFLFLFHIKASSLFFIQYDKKTYRKHWMYFNIGVILKTTLFLIYVRYCL